MTDAPPCRAPDRARGRPRGFDPDAALDRAMEVFWRRGYAGAGMAELTAAMGLAPSSAYAAWGTKRGLFLAALDRYAATLGRRPLDALRGAPPGEGLGAFLAAVVDLVHDGGCEGGRGCFAACAAAEAAGAEPLVRERLHALLGATEAALDGAAAGVPGRLLLAAMHAIAVRARAGAGRGELDALARDLGAALQGARQSP